MSTMIDKSALMFHKEGWNPLFGAPCLEPLCLDLQCLESCVWITSVWNPMCLESQCLESYVVGSPVFGILCVWNPTCLDSQCLESYVFGARVWNPTCLDPLYLEPQYLESYAFGSLVFGAPLSFLEPPAPPSKMLQVPYPIYFRRSRGSILSPCRAFFLFFIFYKMIRSLLNHKLQYILHLASPLTPNGRSKYDSQQSPFEFLVSSSRSTDTPTTALYFRSQALEHQ